MDDGRLSKRIMKWQPKGWKMKNRPRLMWMDGIQNMMQKGLTEDDRKITTVIINFENK